MARATNDNFWGAPRNRIIATAAAALVAVVLLMGNLGGVGIWEPWEANEIAVGQEYATRGAAPVDGDPKALSWNNAVPTFKNRPVDRPLLKTMLLGASIGERQVDAAAIGSLERAARMPMAIAAVLMALLMLAWLYRRFGPLGAAVSTVALASMPAMFMGTHNLAAEILFIVTTSLAIMAFAELTLAKSGRWVWGALYGVALGLAVLDQRLIGLYLVLGVTSMFAVSEVVLAEAVRRRDGPNAPKRFGTIELVGAALAVVASVAVAVWAMKTRPAGEKAQIPAYALQTATVLIPALLTLGMFWFGRKSKPGRAFWSLPGLLGTGIGVVTAVALARTYTAANPILLDGGELFGEVRVLSYMVANHVFEASLLDQHMTFEVAVRQVGFSLFPWVALLPLGFVYLSEAASITTASGRERSTELFDDQNTVRRLLLVWIVMAAVVVSAFSGWSHYFYPAYVPIAAAIGLALSDSEFWTRVRKAPMAQAAMGFVAITIVLMLGKDLERFPSRFIETYLSLQEGFKFPDDFSWGKLYKPLKYLTCLMLAVYFFGLVSWAALAVKRLRSLPDTMRAIRDRRFGDVWGPPSDVPPFVARMQEKEAFRAGDGIVARVAQVFETPQGYAPILALFLAGVAAMFLFVFIPGATNHLSQRGVFEAYTDVAKPGENLWRYQVSARDNSVYLTDVETVQGAAQFGDLFEADERFFVIIPRSKLASVNYDVRKRFKKNLYVLDARSSRLLLASNKLLAGETDKSFVNDKIVEGEPQIDFPVTFESKGEQKHAVFDDQLEFLGYSLDNEPGKDGLVAYSWGDTMTLTYFFKVLKRVPSSQKIFLHVDYPGTRINGDHVPNNGEFTTNYWLEGDTVKSVHPVKIDSYSSPGEYSLNFGFFLGSRRMKVEPREAHDGRDRITIGKIRVNGL